MADSISENCATFICTGCGRSIVLINPHQNDTVVCGCDQVMRVMMILVDLEGMNGQDQSNIADAIRASQKGKFKNQEVKQVSYDALAKSHLWHSRYDIGLDNV